MSFGTEWHWGADKDSSRKIFDAYVDAGGNFFDTANRYTAGTSEKYLGEFIAHDRESFVVATKYTLYTRTGAPNFSGNHRKNMMQAIEASLKRLGTDYVDLYWVHAWDGTTPVEEILRGLDDLVRQGKVLYTGISDTPAWVISKANTMAELRGWTRFSAAQLRYSLIDRTAERDLLPMARHFDMAVTPWSILGAGVLSGKYNRKTPPKKGRAREGAATVQRNLAIADVVIRVARQLKCKPAQVAIAWVRQQPGVIIPLIGANNLAQMEVNLGALEITLEDKHLKKLDEASRIEPGFPHDFLDNEYVRELIFGGTADQIDNHRE